METDMTVEAPTDCDPRAASALRTTSTGLLIRSDVSFESWIGMGRALSDVANGSAWCLGDWLLYGQSAYANRYRAAIDATSLDYQTLRNYAWVAGRFERS